MFKHLCFFIFLCFVFIVIAAERVKAEDAVRIVVNFENSFIPQDQKFIKQCKNQPDCAIKSSFTFQKSPGNSIPRVFESAIKQSADYLYGRVKWWNDLKLVKVKMTPKENNLILVEITGYGGKSKEMNYILKQNIEQFHLVAEEFFSLIIINLSLSGSSGFIVQEFEFDFDGKIKAKVGVFEKPERPPDKQKDIEI